MAFRLRLFKTQIPGMAIVDGLYTRMNSTVLQVLGYK